MSRNYTLLRKEIVKCALMLLRMFAVAISDSGTMNEQKTPAR